MREMSVDLPAFGNPTRPTSASSFSWSRRSLLSPGSPGCTCRGARFVDVAKRALPRPPRPPRATSTRWPSSARSASSCSGSLGSSVFSYTTVPIGTASSRSAPSRPVRFEPWPCSPRSASNSGWKRKLIERVGVRAGDDVDRAAVAAVAAARAAARDELLAAEARQPRPPCPAATWMSTSSTNIGIW